MWYIAYDGYLYNNPDSSLLLGGQMYDFAVEKGELQFQAYALGTQAVASYYLGYLDSAIAFHEKAFLIHVELKNYSAMAASYNNIANIYRERGQLAEALDYFVRAKKILERLGNKTAVGSIYGNIGAVYSDMGDHENARIWYWKALDSKKETDDFISIALLLTGIGEGHMDIGNYDSAMYYNLESLRIRQEIKNLNGIGNSYRHIGEVFLAKGELDSAMFYFRKSLTYIEPLNLQSALTDVYSSIGIIYERQKKYSDALIYAKKAFDIAHETGYLDAERDASFLLFKLYKQKGNFNDALKMHEVYITMRDSMNKEANQKAIIKQEIQDDYDKKTLADSLRREDDRRIEQLQHTQESEKQWFLTVAVASGLGLVVIFLIFVFNRLQVTRKQKKVIEEQKIKVERQKEEVVLAHHELEEKNQEIMDSITYAKRIQSAILPSAKTVKEFLPESFILYKPKDIVAGDFYWLESVSEQSTATLRSGSSSGNEPLANLSELLVDDTSTDSSKSKNKNPAAATAAANSSILFAAADCTGHGVPGAMVSVVCNGALNRAVREFGLKEPGIILDKVREIVIEEFEKSDEEVKDGMDISLCSISPLSLGEGPGVRLKWAGANNPLWIIRKGALEVEEIKANVSAETYDRITKGFGYDLIEVKADKQPIGKYADPKPFTTNSIQLNSGDSIYVFTDGFQDQFGGDKGKKFKAASLKTLLLSIQNESMENQKKIIDEAFENWRGKLEQVDDVCVIGVRV